MRLTRQNIARLSLPPHKSDHIEWDDGLTGFGLRIRAGGRRTWIAQYRVGAKTRRISLGSVDVVEPDEARRHARAALAKAQLGHDPQAEKAADRARASLTLGAVADRYLTQHAEARMAPGSLVAAKYYLNVAFRPLRPLSIDRVDRRTVAARISEIAMASGTEAADRARSRLSSLFIWAMREGLAETNPVAATNRPGKRRRRDRVLSEAELAAIWRACVFQPDWHYSQIVRLLILTGQRRNEVGGMQWDELDLEGRLWRIGSDRTKNRHAHDVPLSDLALEIIGSAPRRLDRACLFGEAEAGYRGFAVAKQTLDEQIAERGLRLPPWTIHDIRRSVVTHLADLGVQPHVIEALLNHVSGHKAGVAGIYNRAVYAAEKRAALELWDNHIRLNLT